MKMKRECSTPVEYQCEIWRLDHVRDKLLGCWKWHVGWSSQGFLHGSIRNSLILSEASQFFRCPAARAGGEGRSWVVSYLFLYLLISFWFMKKSRWEILTLNEYWTSDHEERNGPLISHPFLCHASENLTPAGTLDTFFLPAAYLQRGSD